MAEKKPRKSAQPAKGSETFSAEERAAMKEAVQERKRGKKPGADGESDLLAKIAAMPEPDRSLAGKLHALVKANAPTLSARTWYGMPAWANADDDVVCFFQNAQKFKTRYSTLGFSDKAHLDDGDLWATAFALAKLGSAEEARIVALLKKAVS